MEVKINSKSPLEGTLNRKQRTIIHFDYGGQYVKKGEEILWIARENVHHSLLMRQSVEEVTYDILVESIRNNMGENEAKREMKLSYFPVGVDPKWAIYIFNDDDDVCYLEPCEGKMKCVLHVETKTNDPREDSVSQVNASNEDMVSTGRVNFGVNYESITISASELSEKYATVAHKVECENLENIKVRDICLVEFDNVHVRDTSVVEEDEIHNVEWENGINVKKSRIWKQRRHERISGKGFQVMRKVIIVDGTHLKNAYGRVLLVATAQDHNHHHYLIAFGVVDGEKDGSCACFFNKLKILIPDVPGLVFIFDRNQSIIKIIREVYSLSHHGYCIFHLSQNVKMHASNVKERVAAKFRELSHAYTQVEFQTLYDDFKKRYPGEAEYVERSVESNKWARCFFPSERYNIDTTNCAESLNDVFKETRKYSLLPMIYAIIEKIDEWFNKHRQTSTKTHRLVPFIENVFLKSCVEAQHLAVTVLNNYYLQFNFIGRDGRGYFIDLRMKTCTCKHFDIDKYPCVHAIDALMEARKKEYTHLDVQDLCSKFYAIEQ